jgi:glycosyltransferase involved in cell wall biosynthesis
MIRDMRLQGLVRMTGFVDVPTFQSYILAADVLVNLRYPLAGETSGGLVRAMGMGKPVLVSNVGQYAEFPDDCCLKVDLGESEEEMALAYLDALYRDPELRQQIGEQARRYVQAEHAIERSAQTYLDFMAAVIEDESRKRATQAPGPNFSTEEIMAEIRGQVLQKRWSGEVERPDLSLYAAPEPS